MSSTDPGSNDEQQDVIFGGQPPSHDVELGTPAVIYLHVSASRPAATDRSIAAQREACRRKAAELGFSLVDEQVVLEHLDRKVTTREAFRRVRAQARRPSTGASPLVSIGQRSRWPGDVRRQPCFRPGQPIRRCDDQRLCRLR